VAGHIPVQEAGRTRGPVVVLTRGPVAGHIRVRAEVPIQALVDLAIRAPGEAIQTLGTDHRHTVSNSQ
jgi:hypothetical protein